METDDNDADSARQWAAMPETQKRLRWAEARQQQRITDLIQYAAESTDPSVRALAADYFMLRECIKVLRGDLL